MPLVVHTLVFLALFVLWLWTLGALWFTAPAQGGLRFVLFGLMLFGVPLLLLAPRAPWPSFFLLAAGFLAALLSFFRLRPSNGRRWSANEVRLPEATVDGDLVTIHNVRNTRYRSDDDYDVRYETRTYDLRSLRSVDFVIAPFESLRFGAHTFVSFGFEDGARLALSIEARKEEGEAYGIAAGLYRRFELMYVFGDERDLIGLRTHIRGDELYIYPMRATPEGLRAFFLDTLERANELRQTPVFYNAAVRNCTIELLRHLNRVRTLKVGIGWKILFSGFSDARALELDLIDTDLPLKDARERFRVDPGVTTLDADDFSEAIRRRYGP